MTDTRKIHTVFDDRCPFCEISTLRTQLKSVEAERDEARWLLKHAGDPTWSLNYEQSKDWLKRRHAFLNPITDKKG